ncbi:MAG: hypothetical protein ACRD3T_14890, partial [Terriglobia bacterium]
MPSLPEALKITSRIQLRQKHESTHQQKGEYRRASLIEIPSQLEPCSPGAFSLEFPFSTLDGLIRYTRLLL